MTTTEQITVGTRGRKRTTRAALSGADSTESAVADAAGAMSTPGSSTASSRRAYERRQRRLQKISGTSKVGTAKPVKSALNMAPFVVALIAMLSFGIAGVLWLNTLTDEAGMRTSTAKSKSTDLRLSIEALQRDVAMLDATPKIADEATALGMVPAGDSAMLVIDGSGTASVIGNPSVVPNPVDVANAAAAAAADAAAKAAAEAAAAAAAAAPPEPAASAPPATAPVANPAAPAADAAASPTAAADPNAAPNAAAPTAAGATTAPAPPEAAAPATPAAVEPGTPAEGTNPQ